MCKCRWVAAVLAVDSSTAPLFGVPTLADAILDRVIHNAYRINLSGDSLRKQRSSS